MLITRDEIIKLGNKGDINSINKLFEYLQKCKDRGVQEFTIDTIIKIGNREAVKKALNLLSDDSPFIRNSARVILENIGEKYVKDIIKILNSNDKRIRKMIIDILSKFKSPDVIKILGDYLYDEDINVRYSVIEAIGINGYKDFLDALLRRLTVEQDEWVKYAIIVALGNLDNLENESVVRIIYYLTSIIPKENDVIKEAICQTLAKTRNLRAELPLLKIRDTADNEDLKKIAEESLEILYSTIN